MPKYSSNGLDEEMQVGFNMALAYLKRIDILLQLCNKSRIQLLSNPSDKTADDVWMASLDSIYEEIEPKIDDKEKKEYEKIHSEALKAYIEWNKVRTNTPPGHTTTITKIYPKLNKVESFLRKILYDKGFLMPDKDESDLF